MTSWRVADTGLGGNLRSRVVGAWRVEDGAGVTGEVASGSADGGRDRGRRERPHVLQPLGCRTLVESLILAQDQRWRRA